MTADSRLSRAVPLDELAPDHVLRFTWRDLIELELAAYGVSAEELDRDYAQGVVREPWTAVIDRRLGARDTHFIQEAIRIGAKKPGGFERPDLKPEDLADLPFAPETVIAKIDAALLCAITGKSFADIQKARSAPAEEGILEMLSGRATAQAAE